MKIKFKVVFLISIVFIISLCGNVNAETQYFIGRKSEHERKEEYLNGITEEMCTANYWKDKNFIDINQILMNSTEINNLNDKIVQASGTMVFDLETMQERYNADSIKQSLANTEILSRDLYINGQKINNQEYFSTLQQAILETGYTGEQIIKYGICTNRADLKSWPIDDQIGYSATDNDDEMQSSAMNINEPFIIKAKCKIDGKIFYWGNSINCTGWVNAKNVAICETKEEWLDYWKVDTNANNFVTVTGSRIVLENSVFGKVYAMLGSVLKIVPNEEIPEDLVNQANTNYIVYFAGKNEDGKAERRYGVLNKNLELNKGYLPLTQNNILDVAFSCIGDEYGWGGMNGNMDCSLYTRSIYKCFGLELPRNTTWQQKVPGKFIDTSNMNIEEKKNYLSTLPAGSLFYISGHTMVYVGIDENKNFVVSDLGTVVDEEGEIKIKDVYAVTVNSLNVRRASGTTWLENITGVISFMNPININECEVKIENIKNIYDGTEKTPKVEVTYKGKTIYEKSNYNIKYIDNIEVGMATIEVSGINNFTGKLIKNFEIEREAEKQDDEKQDDENKDENVGKEEDSKPDDQEKEKENQDNENKIESGNNEKEENSEANNQEKQLDDNWNQLQEKQSQKDTSEKQKSSDQTKNNLAKYDVPDTGDDSTQYFYIIMIYAVVIIFKIYKNRKANKKQNSSITKE